MYFKTLRSHLQFQSIIIFSNPILFIHFRFLTLFGRERRLQGSRSLSQAAQFTAAALDLPSVALNDNASYCLPCACAYNVSVFPCNIRNHNINQYHLKARFILHPYFKQMAFMPLFRLIFFRVKSGSIAYKCSFHEI